MGQRSRRGSAGFQPSQGRKANVAVCVPSNGTWNASFGACLATMTGYASQEQLRGYEAQSLSVFTSVGSVLPYNRLQLVKSALEEGATHILFLDSDMTFPRDTLHRLWGDNGAIVAANCTTRSQPVVPTALRFNPKLGEMERVYTAKDSKGRELVSAIGCAVMLIPAGIFTKIEKPWFAYTVLGDGDNFLGEDVTFCSLVQKAGVPIFIDHDLSKEIGHEGRFVYKHEHVGV